MWFGAFPGAFGLGRAQPQRSVRFITRVYRRLWNGCPGRGRSIAGRGSGSMDAMLRLGSKGHDVKDHFGGTEAGSLAGGQQGEGVDVGRECGCFSGVDPGLLSRPCRKRRPSAREDGGVSGDSSSCGARGGFLPRHDEDLTPVWGFSRGMTGSLGSLSCGNREVRSPWAGQGGARI